MNKIICLLCLFCGISSAALAKTELNHSPFQFKLLSSENDIVRLTVIDNSHVADAKKGMAIFRQRNIKPYGEVVLNMANNNKKLSDNETYKIIGYKINQISSTHDNPQTLFRLLENYTLVLEKKYPHRFVTKKRSCMNRMDDFFQCLYDEKESWNTLFYVNNGEISLNLYPVLDDKTKKVIGGAVSIAYTIGSGRLLDRSA
jgi:hypothetical protein